MANHHYNCSNYLRAIMIYIDSTLEDWIAKYKFELTTLVCQYCNVKAKSHRPIRLKGYVGIETVYEGCFHKSYLLTPIGEDEKTFWTEVLG